MNMTLSLMLTLMLVASPLQQVRAFVGQTKQELSVSIKDLRNAPTTIVLDNRSLHLSAYPSRNLMPGPPRQDGSPLSVRLKVTSADQKPLPKGVRMDRAWVLFGEEAWEVPIRGRIIGRDHDKDAWINWINCGDKPVCEISMDFRTPLRTIRNVYVDVVVRLIDSEGKNHLLQAPHQRIVSTS